jgi:DNA-binding beta-propeller fold protein YncE
VAVNEATGEVYVLDQGNDRVEIFAGEPPVVVGEIKEFEVEPGVIQTFSFGAAPQVSGIAVDNSCSLEGLVGPACEDPSNEDVYVVDAGHDVVDKFKSNGEYIGQITEAAGEPFTSLGGVAVDSSGRVWIYQERDVLNHFENGAFYGFTGAQPNAFSAEVPILAVPRGSFAAPGFAVDGEGSFYARGQHEGRFRIEKYDHIGNQLVAALDSENSSGIAVDLKTGNSFLDNLTTVASFRPDGTELERLGNEAGARRLTEGAGLVADSVSETIYVADSAAGRVVVFGPQQPKAPEIVSEGVQNISSAAAILEAELNPRSEVGETSYRFRYGPCSGSLTACAISAFPFESTAGLLAPDFEIHPVSALASGLQPGTPYHFRLVAENGQGETAGPELTFTTQPSGGSLLLPDSRQWQLVSPPDKQGALLKPIAESGVIQAADDGRAISYVATAPTEPEPQGAGVSGGVQVLSARGPAGWLSQDLIPPHDAATGTQEGSGKEYRAFSADLSYSFLNPFGPFTPSISPEASEQSAFRRTNYRTGEPAQQCIGISNNCYTPLVTGKVGVANVRPPDTVFGRQARPPILGPQFVESTPDGTSVVLKSSVALTTQTITGEALYEWSAEASPAEQLQLVSVLPGSIEEPVSTPFLGFVSQDLRNAISVDGSRIIFSEGGNPTEAHGSDRLFLRDTRRNETIQLDAGESCPECESGGARFQLASTDDSRVLFTDIRHLTANSGAEETVHNGGKADLYECRIVESGAGGLGCDLTDLTPRKTRNDESGEVLGSVIGASEDVASVYFVANGVLAANEDSHGEHAEPGTCGDNSVPVGNQHCSLFFLTGGQTRFLSTLSGEDGHDWAGSLRELPARVSPDGRWLAFMSGRSLTGYDNRDRATGKAAAEVYLYGVAADRLICASCDPTGARPHGVGYHQLEPGSGGLVGGPRGTWEQSALVAANVPGWTGDEELGTVTRHQPRYLSDSGRLFFNTVNPLVPQDANGTQDVYQYEPPGQGSCSTSSPTYGELSEGCVSLISSGTSAQESAFLDASENGNDVFFLTSARLSGLDTDSARDVYDAHVCTAEVPCLPEPQPPAPACSGDACQQPATSPNDATPGSLTFNGAGNVIECPKGKQSKKGKCVKKKQKKGKHHKKKHHKNGKGKKSHKAKK